MKHLAHQLVPRRISELKPFATNARTHSKEQIRQIADSLERFGFTNPVLISDAGEIVAGHGRVAAAKLLGWEEVPTLALSHLSATERRAYVIADNKLALNAGWDNEILAAEFDALIDVGFEVGLTGFSVAEIDLTLDAARESAVDGSGAPEDLVPKPAGPVVTRRGDIWKLGRHLLICGDARSCEDYASLMQGKTADVVFTDPPYNVPIDRNVCGLGRVRHREFAMAAGEMTSAEFQEFLRCTLHNAADHLRDGGIAFVCMDWRHIGELQGAGREVFSELKNICVWNKTNGGMGAFYRSKHELVFVFKKGTASHVNNFGLGGGGRYRTNVWDYPGVSSISASRAEDLAMHPTVKPVALVADALRDCSKRGQLVLDPFAGSGTTLIAAHSCGRVARVIEYDPLYCDTIIRRFIAVTGAPAIRGADNVRFDDVVDELTCGAGDLP
jgi:DNA modification methylase